MAGERTDVLSFTLSVLIPQKTSFTWLIQVKSLVSQADTIKNIIYSKIGIVSFLLDSEARGHQEYWTLLRTPQ